MFAVFIFYFYYFFKNKNNEKYIEKRKDREAS